MVSVFVLTYNQENFIEQCLMSILNQKTTFEYEVVIGEDRSGDNTHEICKKFAELYEEKIKLLPSESTNIGLIQNFIRTIKECRGKYIAICDGDDYWIDNNKLQCQVDFLESNPDFSIVYTGHIELNPNDSKKIIRNKGPQVFTNFDNLALNNYVPSPTAIFRNHEISKLPNWMNKFLYGDWPTYLWISRNGGRIAYIDKITAVYRKSIGVSSSLIKKNSSLTKMNLNILKCCSRDIQFENKLAIIEKSISRLRINLMMDWNREGHFLKALGQLCFNLLRERNGLNVIKLYLYSIKKIID